MANTSPTDDDILKEVLGGNSGAQPAARPGAQPQDLPAKAQPKPASPTDEEILAEAFPTTKPKESMWQGVKRVAGEAADIYNDKENGGGFLPALGRVMKSAVPDSDLAIDVARAPITMTQTLAGLGDLATGGAAGKALDAIGYNPKAAQEMLSEGYSDSRKRAQRNVAETAKQMGKDVESASGAWDTTKAALGGAGSLIASMIANPSVIQEQLIQTLPDMMFGAGLMGKIGKTIFAGAAEAEGIGAARMAEIMAGKAPQTAAEIKALEAGKKAVELASNKLSWYGHGIEGAQAAGQNAWQIREDNKNNLSGEYMQLPAGVITALIGRAASKVPGFGDVQTAAQMAVAGPKAATTALGATGGVAKKIGKGMVSEGLLQELPQSAQEQIWQNLAQGKPWHEDVLNQGIQGGVTSAVMGGVGGAITRGHGSDSKSEGEKPADEAPPINPLAEAAAQPDSPLSRAAAAGNGVAPAPAQPAPEPAADPISARVAEIETAVRDGGLVQKLRDLAAQHPGLESDVLSALAVAKNANLPESVRQKSLGVLEGAMQALQLDQASQIGRQWQGLGVDQGGGNLSGQRASTIAGEQWQGLGIEQPADSLAAQSNLGRAGMAWQANPASMEPAGQVSDASGQSALVDASGAPASTFGQTPANGKRAPASVAPAIEKIAIHDRYTPPPGESPATPADSPGQTPANPGQSVAAAVAAEEPEQPRKTVSAPVVGVKDVAGEDPKLPPAVRQRRAQLSAMVKAGFDAVEPRDGKFFLVNHADNYEMPLESAGDAARATAIINAKVDNEAHQSINSPLNDKSPATEAQIAADNYPKPVVHRFGLELQTENPRDSTRSGVDPDGKPWSVTMTDHYGGIKGTKAADGSPVDGFFGRGHRIFVIDQVNPKTGLYDEAKSMIGYRSEEEARKAYLSNYAKGWKGLGAITEMSIPEFRKWVKSSAAALPVSPTIKTSQEVKNDGAGSTQGSDQAGGRVSGDATGLGRDEGGRDARQPQDHGAERLSGATEEQGPAGNVGTGFLDGTGQLSARVGQIALDRSTRVAAQNEPIVAQAAKHPKLRGLKLADPSSPVTQALDSLLDVFEGLTGHRGIAVNIGGSDGFEYRGNTFIDTGNPYMHVGQTIAHEFKHLTEKFPGLKGLYDRLWDMVDDEAGKEAYFGYLLDSHDDIGSHYAGKTLRQAYASIRPEHAAKLKNEMLADFMGKRFNDRAWLTELGKKKPELFGNFIRDWIKALGEIIGKLAGRKDKMEGVKNVDLYISQLQEAKAIAMEVAEEWAKMKPGYAQRTGASQAIQSAKAADTSFSARDYLEQMRSDVESDRDMVRRAEKEKELKRMEADLAERARKDAINREFARHSRGGYALRPRGGSDRAESAQRYIDASGDTGISPAVASALISYVTYPSSSDSSTDGGSDPSFSAKDPTQTPEFKRWFGNSKVVDSNGKPLVVYHGTGARFTVFKPSKRGTYGKGIYFANTRSSAEEFGEFDGGEHRVIDAYVSLQNPWRPKAEFDSEAAFSEGVDSPIVEAVLSLPGGRKLLDDAKASGQMDFGHFGVDLQRALKKLGYDGIIADYGDGSQEIVAFDPAQIKSATGNNGQFDPANPDITRSARPLTDQEINDIQAELDAELSGAQPEIEPDVSDAAIRRAGIHAEDAFPPHKWSGGGDQYTLSIKGLYGGERTVRLAIDKVADGQYETSIEGAWVGPAAEEPTGYVSLKGAKAFIDRQIAARELRARGYDLVSSLPAEQRAALREGWEAINAMGDEFGVRRFPLTSELDTSIQDLAKSMGLTEAYKVTSNEEVNDRDNKTLVIAFTDKATGKTQSGTVSMTRFGGKWHTSASTIEFKKGGLGTAFYQLAVEYLARKGLQLSPEATLSGINTYRRTEQMLAAALRIGISNAMVPHPVQRVYGFQNDAQSDAEHAANLERLLIANLRNVRELVPEFDRLRYHPETGAITFKNGRDAENVVDRLIGHRGEKLTSQTDARAFGLGRTTLARALMTQAMLDGKFQEPESFAEPVTYSARDQAAIEYAAVEAKYKGTPQWMKAPNGKPTKLTERQWVQVRTNLFQKWFGPWEKYAGTRAGVWGDTTGEVSKAVDENGEPMVVYHGSDYGGFMAFETPGGQRRGDMGIFTTSDYDMADSYVRRNKTQDVEAPDPKAAAEDAGVEFYEYQGRVSSRQAEDQTLYGYRTPLGDEVDGFASQDDAIHDAASVYAEIGRPGSQPGIYALFINLRNPRESDFEGATWNGSREHQWVVEVGGEIQADANGTQYFDSKEDAAEFAKTFVADDAEGDDADPLSYVRGADDHYKSTDDAVREAWSYGNDGAIIRNVIDDGGGPGGYMGEPRDVFVARHGGQLKSANWNTGEFGQSTDDLRYSAREIRKNKDGSIEVIGDADEIRAALPGGMRGRKTQDGLRFTRFDAPRVTRAIEGSANAYGRGGEVIDRHPLRNGKYIGAPEKFNTPQKLPHFRRILRNLAIEGERGRFWYEQSSREILRMVGGDVNEARRFVALLSIYSPQAKVDANSTFALRAWAQYKAGQQINVKTRVMDTKAQNAMADVDAFWSGEKTGNFFNNLLRMIDPSTEGRQGATIDMWMMRAGQYKDDLPSKTQYAFMELESNRLAAELGWEPQQVQAAIWVAMKARMENAGVKKRTEQISLERGWIHYKPGKGGSKVRVIDDAQKHRDNWLAQAMAHKVTAADTAAAKFDFSDGVRRHIGQVSWEARPGRSTGVLPGVNDAPYAQQVEFQQAVQKALHDDSGVDLLAQALGLLTDGPDILAPGVWQGEVAAGMQTQAAMAPAKGNAGISSVDANQKSIIDAYASALGLLLRQEGVGWHRPFFKGRKQDENGVELRIGGPLSHSQAKELWSALDSAFRSSGVQDWESGAGMISSPAGMRIVNFGAVGDNSSFHKLVESAASGLSFDVNELAHFSSDGDLLTNDWKANPDGASYQTKISEAGRSDLLGWLRDVLAPRIQSVFDEYSAKYGWGDPGRVAFSARDDASAGRGGHLDPAEPDLQRSAQGSLAERQDQPAAGGRPDRALRVQGAVHFGKAPGLSVLSGSASGTGIKGAEQERLNQAGVDPRLKRRVYFYLPVDGGIPQPEIGLGTHVYKADLGNLYDPSEGKIRGEGNPFELAVLNAGYDGYVNREQGTAVLLNRDAPVSYEGRSYDHKLIQRRIERVIPKTVTRQSGDELVRRPEASELGSVIRNREAIKAAAPSFRMEFGEARVKADEAPAADAILEKAGSTFRFGEVNMSARDVTETPEFKRWFKNSKVVDASGRPLVVYHGTDQSFNAFREGTGWFTVDPMEANFWGRMNSTGANVMPTYLSIKNPRILQAATASKNAIYDALSLLTREQDGVLVIEDGQIRWAIVADPTQIKSTTGNNGQFDPGNPDITRSARSPIGFYSELSEQIEKSTMRQAPAAAWKTFIKALSQKGVKPDEIEWTGVNEWLDLQDGKVSKDALLDYLGANGVQVEEKVLGGDKWSIMDRMNEALKDTSYHVESGGEEGLFYIDGNGDLVARGHLPKHIRDRLDALENAEWQESKYAQYTLPGGENYREVLLTLPPAGEKTFTFVIKEGGGRAFRFNGVDYATEQEARAAEAAARRSEYKSSHWNQANVLAHIRVNDRVDADGKRVLLVEEIQSDLQQDYRRSVKRITDAVESDFHAIVDRMKKAGVLEVECD